MSQSLPLFPEMRFPTKRSWIRVSEAVVSVARRLWPSKTAVNLASRCDVGERAAQLWMEGRNDISADALVALLRSDAGYDVLQELMQGASTSWWREFERGVRIRDIETKIELHRRALSALKVEISR